LNKAFLKACILPGGALLLAASVALQIGTISTQAIDLYYYAVCSAGILIAWRFHSSRILFVLLTLILGHHAIEYFAGGHRFGIGPGRTAFEVVSLLIPLNFIIFSLSKERGFAIPNLAPRLLLVFFEAVVVAVMCRPQETAGPHFLHSSPLDPRGLPSSRIPQIALLTFLAAIGLLLARLLRRRQPIEHGLLWSLLAALVGFQNGTVGRIGEGYFATGGLILIASLLENSYFLAYHDELTGLPARRAFNEALSSLQAPFAVAMVDIDHFKKVNDTYGHDTGDQVLSLVASRLARIGSGGKAYRVGGEEFSILFSEKTVKEVVTELEALRITISELSFRIRNTPDRRNTRRGPDRRQVVKRTHPKRTQISSTSTSGHLSVTVSIGVAEPDSRTPGSAEVIQAADKALYRAKRGGRNRVELASIARPMLARRVASR